MVAPLPVGLPLSIYDNVAFAPRCVGAARRGPSSTRSWSAACARPRCGTRSRTGSTAWAPSSSGGQQQRLTIARALSHQPEILCLDEFSIAIDPVTTMRIEDVLKELRREMTIVLVTNLTQQARRLADRTMFLLDGELVELDRTEVIFSSARAQPAHPRLRERDVRMSDRRGGHAIETRRPQPLVRQLPGAQGRDGLACASGLITSLIGPSGCGKTTLLRCFNRINERYGNVTHRRARSASWARTSTRRRLAGRAAQGAWAWCSSGPTRCRSRSTRTWCSGCACTPDAASSRRSRLDEAVEKALGEVGLWDDLKDRLDDRATPPPARAAAEAVHRPAPAAQAGGDPDGRALLGARRRGHARDRGADVRAARAATRS